MRRSTFAAAVGDSLVRTSTCAASLRRTAAKTRSRHAMFGAGHIGRLASVPGRTPWRPKPCTDTTRRDAKAGCEAGSFDLSGRTLLDLGDLGGVQAGPGALLFVLRVLVVRDLGGRAERPVGG